MIDELITTENTVLPTHESLGQLVDDFIASFIVKIHVTRTEIIASPGSQLKHDIENSHVSNFTSTFNDYVKDVVPSLSTKIKQVLLIRFEIM